MFLGDDEIESVLCGTTGDLMRKIERARTKLATHEKVNKVTNEVSDRLNQLRKSVEAELEEIRVSHPGVAEYIRRLELSRIDGYCARCDDVKSIPTLKENGELLDRETKLEAMEGKRREVTASLEKMRREAAQLSDRVAALGTRVDDLKIEISSLIQ